jgi:hypothetical protein
MPAATARPVQQMVGAAHIGMAARNGRPGMFTWFSNLSVGNKIATVLVALFALWIVVMLPLWLIYAVVTAGFAGSNNNNGAPVDELPMAETFRQPIFGLKIAQAIKPPTPTPTPIPPTPIPTPQPTAPPVAKQVVQRVAPTPEPAPEELAVLAAPAAPVAPLPPLEWDNRLGPGGLPLLQGIGLTPAQVTSGQKYWRLIRMKFEDAGQESGNDHTIYVALLDSEGNRDEDEAVEISWDDAGTTQIERLDMFDDQKPKGDYCECNYNWPMYGAGYRVRVDDEFPSDQPYGMIMPMKRHVNYRLTFQLVTVP